MVDPNNHPASLTINVRALPRTERALQNISAAAGFTFWGEAANLIFDCFATDPRDCPDLTNLMDAPQGLLRNLAPFGANVFNISRGFQVPLTPAAKDWLSGVARTHKIDLVKAAALVLYHHAPRIAATLSIKCGGES